MSALTERLRLLAARAFIRGRNLPKDARPPDYARWLRNAEPAALAGVSVAVELADLMALLARVDELEHRAGRGRAAAEERERWVRGWNRARAILRQGGRTEAQRRRALRVLGLIEDDATERRYWRDRELVARWDALTGRVPDLHLMGPPRPVLSPADALEVIAAEQFKGSAVAAKKALQRAADNVNDQAAIAGLPRL